MLFGPIYARLLMDQYDVLYSSKIEIEFATMFMKYHELSFKLPSRSDRDKIDFHRQLL